MDHNATTTTTLKVRATVASLMHEPLNASSVHAYGRKAKAILNNARNTILQALNAQEQYDLIFTSSGTEANNLIIHNFAHLPIFISAIEHLSIYTQSNFYSNIQKVKVNAEGQLDLGHLATSLREVSTAKRKLVSVMFANNETGIRLDLPQILSQVKEAQALMHSDCVQALGKVKLDLKELPLDYLTLSAHKCGGPVGVGALVFRKNLNLIPQLIGGGQEKSLRAGTEMVALIAGFAEAVREAQEQVDHYTKHTSFLRDILERQLRVECPRWQVVDSNVIRIPNTSLFLMQTNSPKANLINLELKGFALSSGSACSSGKIGASHVLLAMGFSEEDARSAIRVSLGMNNTYDEIAKLVSVLKLLHNNN